MLRIIGLVVFVLSIPFFIAMMKGPASYRRAGWFMIGAAPFFVGYLHLDVSVVSWAMWPGYVKGIIVSLLDSLALAIVVTERPIGRGRPLLWAYLLFLVGSSIATVFSTTWFASFMWTWQLARMVLVFAAVSLVAARPEGFRQIVGGLALGVGMQAVIAMQQRAHGITQATGIMGHQNLLGLSTHFALFLCLAAMLSGDRRWLPKIGVAGALISVVLTGSRATTGLAGAGVILLVLLSLQRRRTALKMRVATAGIMMLLAAAPVAALTLHTRFATTADTGSYDERAAFERAAKAVWRDHPMGVGANQYVVAANTGGYSKRAGVAWSTGSLGANVHNTYLLLGAETGPLGLGTFLLLLIGSIVTGLRLAFAKPRGVSGEVALGGAVTLIVVAIHCLFEWVFVTWIIQYLFAITLGVIAGTVKRQQLEVRERKLHRVHSVEPDPVPTWRVPVPA